MADLIGKIIEILMTALILIMYAIFLPVIGFVFSTFFASSFISWRLGAQILALYSRFDYICYNFYFI